VGGRFCYRGKKEWPTEKEMASIGRAYLKKGSVEGEDERSEKKQETNAGEDKLKTSWGGEGKMGDEKKIHGIPCRGPITPRAGGSRKSKKGGIPGGEKPCTLREGSTIRTVLEEGGRRR